jgi:hypothetical protein
MGLFFDQKNFSLNLQLGKADVSSSSPGWSLMMLEAKNYFHCEPLYQLRNSLPFSIP